MSQKDCGCPIVQNEEWEGRTFNWEGKTFYSEKVNHFFKVPLNVENKMAVAAEAIEKQGYMLEEPLMVLVQEGTFSGAVFVAILPSDQQDANVVTFGNTVIETTVYDRRHSKVGPGVKAFRKRLEGQNKQVTSIYLWHLGCPRCAALEGYKTVIFARTG
jgi:hypothetical protein